MDDFALQRRGIIDIHLQLEGFIRVHDRFPSRRDLDIPISPLILDYRAPQLTNFPGCKLFPKYPPEIRDRFADKKSGDPFARLDHNFLQSRWTITQWSEFLDEHGGQILTIKDEVVFGTLDGFAFDNGTQRIAYTFLRRRCTHEALEENRQRG